MQMMSNPDFVRQMLNPGTLRQMMQMQQMMGGIGAGGLPGAMTMIITAVVIQDELSCGMSIFLCSSTDVRDAFSGAMAGQPGAQPPGTPDFASMMGMMGGMPGMGALGSGGVPPIADPETAYATQIQQLVDMGTAPHTSIPAWTVGVADAAILRSSPVLMFVLCPCCRIL